MASIVVAGDTSGTVTLTAPLVAGTTTLTLPTVNGTVLTSASSVARSQLPSGTILQALQATNNTVYSISGNGTFTGLSITITPTSASSRFLLIGNIGQISQIDGGGGGSTIGLNFARNGSTLNYISGGSVNGMNVFVNAGFNNTLTAGPTLTFIDSPATTSAITYTVIYFADGTKWVGRRGADTYIAASQQFQVLEIA